MNRCSLNSDLAVVVAEVLGTDPEGFDPKITRESFASWDSLTHLRLVTAVEERFGIELSMTEIQSIENLGDLERTLAGHLT